MAKFCKNLLKGGYACCLALAFVLLGPGNVSCLVRARVAFRVLHARMRNQGRSASSFGEQLVLVSAILRIPRDRQGVIAEFGCYKGLSTVAISIAAKFAGRDVIVFDSFEGLPAPTETVHQVATGTVIDYKQGDWAGTLEEVRSVVSKYGEIETVEFVKGFFNQTLPLRPADERYALIFEDADLVESVRDVLTHAWPKLEPESCFFSHEALDLEVAKLFFDDDFWLSTLGCRAPGLVGVGLGLPIDPKKWGTPDVGGYLGSCLAGLIKRPTQG